MAKTRFFRWKGIVPMLVLTLIVGLIWYLYIDTAIEKSVEFVGAEVVGARVDLDIAELNESEGRVVLSRLQVANPDAPMTNLVDIPHIVADLNVRALTEKKIVVESLIVTGVRFGTARTESGVLENPSPATGRITRNITSWAASIPTPELNLTGITGAVVNLEGITRDSMKSLGQARALQAAADSTRTALETQIRQANPEPLADSARALVQQLQAMQGRRVDPVQATRLANEARAMVSRISEARTRVAALQQNVQAGVRSLQDGVAAVDAARRADMEYARNLVSVPSLAGPDISMSLFGDMAKQRAGTMLRYVQTAEQYVPPGLDPRRKQGPERVRASGTTFTFPKEQEYPTFLLERAVASLAIGGASMAAGAYGATVSGFTTEPALYGRPMTFSASRRSDVGPSVLSVGGMINRLGAEPRDSIHALVGGVPLPALPIPRASATLNFAGGTTMDIALVRNGGSLSGTWRMMSDSVQWTRSGATAAPADAPIGSREWAEALLWNSLASIPRFELTIRISGSLTAPDLMVSSNVGDVVATNLRRALGAEIERAERRVRERVDALVSEQVSRARASFGGVEQQLSRVTGQVEALDRVKAELEEQIRRSTGGVRLPTLPGLPRP